MEIIINTKETTIAPNLKTRTINNQLNFKDIPFNERDLFLKFQQAINRLKKLKWNGKVVIKFYPRAQTINATAKLTQMAYTTIEQEIQKELNAALNELQLIAKQFEFSYQISITKK